MDLQKRLAEVAEKHGVPGAAIAIWSGGELLEAATGTLNLNTGVETDTDSLFQVGSTTKVWTAALVMQLVEEGLVDLDRPVTDYLPEFPVAGAITVRHLLTHTAGFDGDLFEDTGRGDDCLGKYVAYLKDAGHVHEPGALFSYCNAGFCVLGALVAKVRGADTWEQVMRERLFGPLGVTHAALLAEEALLFRASAGHVGAEPAVYPKWQMPRSNAPAGSTMCLAPRELVRFGRMVLNCGVAEDGTRVLAAETVAAMLEPQVSVPGIPGLLPGHWGLGFELFGWGAVGHDGGTIGQTTFWRIVPGTDFVIAMSGNGGAAIGLITDLAVPLIRELTGLDLPELPAPPAHPGPVDTGAYVGRYAGPQLAYEVAAADDGLSVTVQPGDFMAQAGMETTTSSFVHLADDSFIALQAEAGRHEVLTFVMREGRAAYLHNGRALPRA